MKASEIGIELRKMRERRTWTQRELSDKSGVSLNRIKWYEINEGSIPTFDVVVKIFRALGYELYIRKVR